MQFPRLVYRSASEHLSVATEEQHAAALKDDWFASVPEAEGKKNAIAPTETAPAPVSAPKATAGKGKQAIAAPAPVSAPWAQE
jgi:hypothetical protein